MRGNLPGCIRFQLLLQSKRSRNGKRVKWQLLSGSSQRWDLQTVRVGISVCGVSFTLELSLPLSRYNALSTICNYSTDPIKPDTFWINPYAVHFGQMTVSALVQVDEQCCWVGGAHHEVNAAGFIIHSEIHRARPDINAACHCHSPCARAWSTFGQPIDTLNQGTPLSLMTPSFSSREAKLTPSRFRHIL